MSIITNRKAYHEYHIIEEYVAGMKLVGSEVKSIFNGDANLNDSYVLELNNEIYVRGMYIAKHKESTYLNHDEVRDRKLLLTKKQIRDIQKELKVNGITLIPLCVLESNGKFKLKIGLAKGKKNWDKKNSIKNKDINRQTQRELSE
jgi:SsrA-binding protein